VYQLVYLKMTWFFLDWPQKKRKETKQAADDLTSF
jgi:hypothetical protein